MSEKMPYTQVARRITSDIDYIMEESYLQGKLQGKHDAEQDLARAAYEEAYQKGFEAGQHEATTLEYQQGLDDAWNAARKIALMDTETSENVTGYFGLFRIMENLTSMQAIEKLKAYEEQKKANDEIKVGDEVKNRTDDCGVVTGIYGNDTYVLWQDGSTGDHAADELIKTGRHFNFLTPLLMAMKEGAE